MFGKLITNAKVVHYPSLSEASQRAIIRWKITEDEPITPKYLDMLRSSHFADMFGVVYLDRKTLLESARVDTEDLGLDWHEHYQDISNASMGTPVETLVLAHDGFLEHGSDSFYDNPDVDQWECVFEVDVYTENTLQPILVDRERLDEVRMFRWFADDRDMFEAW